MADPKKRRVDLEAYLCRIGLGASPAADLAGLEALHEAHCAAIPFENLDILLGRPISLDLGSLQAKLVTGRRGGYCFEQIVREGSDSRVLQASLAGEWHDFYAFTLEPQHAVDYEMANHFTSTYPRSPFVLNLTAQRARRHRRAILRNRDLSVREGDLVQASTLRDADHLLEVLAAEFDLAFPPGTRFSRPEFK